MEFMKTVREICEAKTNASEDLVDGLNLGQFPRNENLMVTNDKKISINRNNMLKNDVFFHCSVTHDVFSKISI